MSACPSGALVPVPMFDIDMGTAVWRESSCLRARGEDCTLCVDKCPLGSAAIELVDSRIVVHPLGCVGCGSCQQHCPTSPRSIVVIPKSVKES
jgi:ferredoxin-type protein NapG